MKNQIEKANPTEELAKELNHSVFSVLDAEGLKGFEKAYLIANAAGELKRLLTPEYMKPIMDLQGNRLGFKTDKDNANGYDMATVKNCLIEAVLTGVQPFGNQFNIIAGNCYITKEGFGYLLSKYPGLSYEIIPMLPRINTEKTSAAVVMKIKWSLGGGSKEREIDIPVKMNSFMGTDAAIGKATRKARAWLFNTITGSEIGDGDATDADVISTTITKEPILLEDLKTLFELKRENLSEDEIIHIERVFKAKETASYQKVKTLLNSK
jgi:hypothetical protein